jgi:hypothetical protein
MIGTRRLGTIVSGDKRLLALFGGLVFDGIVFLSLMVAIAILCFM